ncbi:amidohydrolase [Robiginitalea sp. SC105]|uniref:amidohydrolase n=1 Tax=Robiginitalea sp. SC105 TaxID=2762332 RepID=UPI00163AD143|nr:amidohydrolase [Robiginitalea sp. SC105]MBC2839749.1 amidohydrolase [Robiginitalea sp. SC105]
MNRFLTLLCLALLAGCQPPTGEADLIVFNARVYTVDSSFSKAEAFAVRNGEFLAVGSNDSIRAAYAAPWMLDAGGKTIVPGLIDAHCHFLGLGLDQELVNLVGTTSFEAILDSLSAAYQATRPDYLMGTGWDQNDWEVKEFPDKKALDSLFPDIPVALVRVDGHALLVNQRTLDLAGITGETRVPGGEVVLENGEPTGILVDTPMDLVYRQWPVPDKQALIRALQRAEALCLENGLTTVNDAGLGRGEIELIDSLQQAGELSIRVYAMVSNTPENLDYFLERGIYKTPKLNVRSVKVYADGALGSRGAALKAPYSDQPGHYGAMITPAEDLEALARRIAAAGYQMNTHAIGDSANVAVLRAYTRALEGIDDSRWKVEHAQIVDTEDIGLFSPKILPSVQPTHATSDMYWAEDRLGPERMEGAYAFQKLLEASGLVALGTDFPVEKVNPMDTFYAAVARMDAEGYPEGGFQMNDALTREQALKGMTRWAAYSNFTEGEKGSIEAGKRADFVILGGDLMELPPRQLRDIRVTDTFIDGVKVY